MATAKQISLAIIACAQTGSALKRFCKEPASPGCEEPFLDRGEENGENGVDLPWMLWKSKFNKTYKSDEEEAYRHSVWINNTEFMMRVNEKPNTTFSLGWNSQSDLTSDEFAQFRGLYPRNRTSIAGVLGSSHLGELRYDGKLKDLPSDQDWSLVDVVVTEVKEQKCSDCWAFAASAALEGALGIAIGWTTSLSPQQLVDCSGAGSCASGGNPGDAMRWAKDNFACSWDSYPYTASDGYCNSQCEEIIQPGSIWGTYSVTALDEGALCMALLQRPISVWVDADDYFNKYQSGVFNNNILDEDKYSWQINHAVLAVGYGYYNGQAYWKIKNSWGSWWGLDGYVLLARGDGKNQNGVMERPEGVYVYGEYNPSTHLTDLQGVRISPPTQAVVVA